MQRPSRRTPCSSSAWSNRRTDPTSPMPDSPRSTLGRSRRTPFAPCPLPLVPCPLPRVPVSAEADAGRSSFPRRRPTRAGTRRRRRRPCRRTPSRIARRSSRSRRTGATADIRARLGRVGRLSPTASNRFETGGSPEAAPAALAPCLEDRRPGEEGHGSAPTLRRSPFRIPAPALPPAAASTFLREPPCRSITVTISGKPGDFTPQQRKERPSKGPYDDDNDKILRFYTVKAAT